MEASKRFQFRHNVTIRILDKATGQMVREHTGHNTATNTLIEGVGHYLAGQSVLRQGYYMLSRFIPRYISLGTMGLRNQDEDAEGLPTGISGKEYTGDEATDFANYMKERPGYGADGYSKLYNNNRPYMGLGPAFTSFSSTQSYYAGDIVYYKGVAYEATEDIIVDPDTGLYNYWDSNKWRVAPNSEQPICYELITPSAPRVEISFRDVVPEYEAEVPQTVDVVFSSMISTASLAQFRDPGKDYIFISEAGLWSRKDYQPQGTGVNGLVAGYRIAPPSRYNRYMKPDDVPDSYAIEYLEDEGITDPTEAQIADAKTEIAEENRKILKEEILRVERGQVVQVIWKIQIGNFNEEGSCMASSSRDIQDLQNQIDILNESVTELYTMFGSQILFDDYVVIPTSRWESSSTYAGYGYQAAVTFPGVDASYFTMVEFEDADVDDFRFAPISKSDRDKIYVYCATHPSRNIIIPIIMCYKGTRVDAY